MKPVKDVRSVTHRVNESIDYESLAKLYNAAALNDGVEMTRVYNITLFKRALSRRGIEAGKDFEAFSHGEVTIVKRLSTAVMSRG